MKLRVNESLCKKQTAKLSLWMSTAFLILTAESRIICIDTVLLANCWREKYIPGALLGPCVHMHACVCVIINCGSDTSQNHISADYAGHVYTIEYFRKCIIFHNPICCHMLSIPEVK